MPSQVAIAVCASKPTKERPKTSYTVDAQDADFYVHPHLSPDSDPLKGRLLRASAPVRTGTVVLVDTPYAIVPIRSSSKPESLICSNLVCSRSVPALRGVCCPKMCNRDVVWCDEICRGKDYPRHEFECCWLSRHGETLRRREGDYNFLTLWHVVRLLAGWSLESSNGLPREDIPHFNDMFRRHWESVDMCCAYLDSWPESQLEHWKRLAATYMGETSGLSLPRPMSSQEMLLLICKEETNTFGLYPKVTGPLYMIDRPVPRGESYGFGLYPRAAMFNHSCAPSVGHPQPSSGSVKTDKVPSRSCISRIADAAWFTLRPETLLQAKSCPFPTWILPCMRTLRVGRS